MTGSIRQGIDYLAGITPWEAKALGATFVCRYVSNLTRGEADQLTALGLDIVAIFESSPAEARNNAGAGAWDAASAFARARAAGMPNGRPVMFAVDFDDTAAPQVIVPYFEGVSAEALRLNGGRKGTRGAYGGLATIATLFDRGLIDFGWQTSAWSSEGHPLKWDGRAHLRQVSYHSGFDRDEAVAIDFGQWNTRPPTPPAPLLTATQRGELQSAHDHLPAIIARDGRLTRDQLGQLQTMHTHIAGILGVK